MSATTYGWLVLAFPLAGTLIVSLGWRVLPGRLPGFIATAMTERLNDKQREAILARVPAGRLGAGADVAAAAVFLASDEAAYVTGQTLHVNGGMAMI